MHDYIIVQFIVFISGITVRNYAPLHLCVANPICSTIRHIWQLKGQTKNLVFQVGTPRATICAFEHGTIEYQVTPFDF
jgi:hypothetical protein